MMVDEYLECGVECGMDTEYYLVQLLTTLNLKETYQPIDHGTMATVIRYQAPYLINNTSSLILPFILGDDTTLRIIIGIPRLLTMGTIVNLVKDQLVRSEFNQVFILQLDSPGKGLLDSVTYESSFANIPVGIFSNVTPLFSLIQCTTSDGTTFLPIKIYTLVSLSYRSFSSRLCLTIFGVSFTTI